MAAGLPDFWRIVQFIADLTGSISRPKNPSNVSATRASPVAAALGKNAESFKLIDTPSTQAVRERLSLYSFSSEYCCCRAVGRGRARKERNCDHFVGIENSKKRMEQSQKLARNSDPFSVPLRIGTFLEGLGNGPISGPAFWCRRATFEPVLGTANGATVSSATQVSNSKL